MFKKFNYLGILSIFIVLSCGKPNSKPAVQHDLHSQAQFIASKTDDLYLNKIQPIFAAKCINCHGCNASPCEMKLDSFAAVDRGANAKRQPFAKHLPDLTPLRMKDATRISEWRAKDFFPVIHHGTDENENLEKSLLYKFVKFGMDNNAPESIELSSLSTLMEKEAYAIGERSCPDLNKFDEYIAKPEHRFAGMPLALPSLTPQEFKTLEDWIAQGAPGPSAKAVADINRLTRSEAMILKKWEDFLNPSPVANASDKNKNKLVTRYIYEHVFLSRIEIEGIPNRFFEIVRASAPAPAPIRELVTETATDGVPGGGEFYYRLKQNDEIVVQKSLLVWKLNDTKLKRIHELFYSTPWPTEPVSDVPYVTDNPFFNFAQIPAKARSRFMLDENKLIINGMIRGPVCVGPSATYAIRDHFWVFFANPNQDITVNDPTLGATAGLPSSPQQVEFMMSKNFRDFDHSEYRKRFRKLLKLRRPNGLVLADVWTAKKDPHALNRDGVVQTIFRQGNSATVVSGARGRTPPTLWFMTYAGYERLYYNLVTQYKYWGHVQHRLETWQMMRRHREEFEQGFATLATSDESLQEKIIKSWTSGKSGQVLRKSPGLWGRFLRRSDEKAKEAISAKVEQLKAFIGEPTMKQWDNINVPVANPNAIPENISTFAEWESALAQLTARAGQEFSQFLPDALYLKLSDGTEDKVYSFLTYRGYINHSFSVGQKFTRKPEEDYLSVFPGIIGDFPNLMVDLKMSDAANFVKMISALDSEAAFRKFQNAYGVLRNNPQFWDVLASIQELNYKNEGSEAGLLDLNYYGGF